MEYIYIYQFIEQHENVQKLLYDTKLQNKPHHNLIEWEK
jgi:hypothetical protein